MSRLAIVALCLVLVGCEQPARYSRVECTMDGKVSFTSPTVKGFIWKESESGNYSPGLNNDWTYTPRGGELCRIIETSPEPER